MEVYYYQSVHRPLPVPSLTMMRLYRSAAGVAKKSMASKYQAMIDSFGLVVTERRQFREGRRLRFVQNGFGQGLKLLPAIPFQLWRMGDLTQHAAPLDDHAVDVARAKSFRDPTAFIQWIFVN